MTKEKPLRQRTIGRRRLWAAVACSVLTISALTAVLPAEAATTGATAAHPARPSLPLPTGRYQVSEVSLHLVDHSGPTRGRPVRTTES